MGFVSCSELTNNIYEEVKPDYAFMCGICAGDKNRVNLGDIIVVEKAFIKTGKMISGKDGKNELLPDIDMFYSDPYLLVQTKLFKNWKKYSKKLKRPISKKQQKDWIISKLLESKDTKPLNWNERNVGKQAPLFKEILLELQNQENPILNERMEIINPEQLRYNLFFRNFPYKDPCESNFHIGTMQSCIYVRADDPFNQLKKRIIRSEIAIDMEGATFLKPQIYHRKVRALLVKSVCDFADSNKDDSFHKYAANK